MNTIVNKNSARILVVDGKEYSEETVKAALTAHANFEEKPYQFKMGDVVRNSYGEVKIIFYDMDSLASISTEGRHQHSFGQKMFEEYGYTKIGVLSEYLPSDDAVTLPLKG